MSRRVMVCACALIGCAGSAVAAPARVYEVVDLGSFAGGTVASRISESGHVTGFAWPGTLNGYRRAFVWSKSSGMTNLGHYQGLYTSIGTAVDDMGRVGGISFPGVGTTPILSNGAGGWSDLSSIAPNGEGWRLGAPVGMDAASGRITFERGYTWAPGESQAQLIGEASRGRGGGFTVAQSTGMAGQMAVGSGFNGGEHAYVWTPDHGIHDVHDAVGGDSSVATAVSRNGFTAFMTERDFGGPQPTRGDFEVPPGGGANGPRVRGVIAQVDAATGEVTGRINLGGVSALTGVNDFGHATGMSSGAKGNLPTLFRDGRRYEANALLQAGSGWAISELADINSCGDIVGTGYNAQGQQRAVLLRLAAPPMQVQDDNRTSEERRVGKECRSRRSPDHAGCFVTSTSMLLNTFGHQVNPGQLNSYLTPHMTTTGFLSFSEIPSSSSYGQGGEEGVPVNFRSHTFTGTTREALIAEVKRLTAEHGPIILRVPYYSSSSNTFDYANGTHAIVAYRVEDGEILVRNPGSYHSGIDESAIDTLTLDQYIAYENNRRPGATQLIDTNLSWLRQRWATFAEASGQEDALQGSMHSPVEFVITDPMGRRLGFDPTANGGQGEFYNEIPDSFYARADAIRSPEGDLIGGDPFLPIDFYVADMVEGDYSFTLFALADGEWTLNFGISDIDGFDPREFLYQGTTDELAGGATFTVTYEVPGPSAVAAWLVAGVMTPRRRRGSHG